MTKLKDSKIDFLQPDIYTGIIKPNGYTTAELDALSNPQTGWVAFDSDKDALVFYDGTDWETIADADELEFVNVPAFSSKWTSNATVAKFAGGAMAVMKGSFDSTADNNEDPMLNFPSGYRGSFSKQVSYQRSGNYDLIAGGQTTWSGGGVTHTVNVTGAKTSHIVIASYDVIPITTGELRAKILSNGVVTFTCSNAVTNNDAVVNYMIYDASSLRYVDMGTSSGVAGITPVANTGDKVWVDVVYNVVSD